MSGNEERDPGGLSDLLERPALRPAPEFERRLLADYDAAMRARRGAPLAAVADAFGWPLLARPAAPMALGAAIVIAGGALGAATAPGPAADDAYVYIAAALDPPAGFSAEVASWAEQ